VFAPIVVVAAPPVSAEAIAAALAAANATASTIATPAPTDAAVAGEAASHSTYSIFGTDSEDDDTAKNKHHVSIGELLAKMDPKVPKTITATTRKRKAVVTDLCDTKAALPPVVTRNQRPKAKRKATVPYTPIVACKSKASNKKA
jgi:hypothetical protein